MKHKILVVDVNPKHGLMVSNTAYLTSQNVLGVKESSISQKAVIRPISESTYTYLPKVVTSDVGVVNLSISENMTFTDKPQLTSDGYFKSAFLSGVTIVAANGNFSTDPATKIVDSLSANPYAIAVSAVKGGSIASYALANPAITAFVTSGDSINITPDGTGTVVGQLTGTSFAAPKVAAAVSYAKLMNTKGITESEVRTLLERASDGIVLDNVINASSAKDVYQQLNFNEFKSISTKKFSSFKLESQIDAAYELVLNRNADAAGLDWYMKSGMTIGQVVTSLKASPEAQIALNRDSAVPVFEKVQAMYHLFLGRESDDKGVSYWIDEIMDEGLELASVNEFEPIIQAFLVGAKVQEPAWW